MLRWGRLKVLTQLALLTRLTLVERSRGAGETSVESSEQLVEGVAARERRRTEKRLNAGA